MTKKVTVRVEDIFREIHERATELQMKLGKRFKPLRVLLGPNQFLAISQYVKEHPLALGIGPKDVFFGYPETIMGYPVGLKRSDGIEFEFDPSCALLFAHGNVE